MALQVEASQFWSNVFQLRDAELRLHGGAGESGATGATGGDPELAKKVKTLEQENSNLKKNFSDLEAKVKKLEARLTALEKGSGSSAPAASAKPAPAKPADDDDEDSDFELFGSDDEEDDEEAERIKAERVAAYTAKKATKKQVIAKSNVILDVKPWDDETDLKAMEAQVRSIQMDGLLWGAAKFVPLAYGVKKLQISTVIEDDLVSTDELQEKIEAFEDLVQSTDIAAFNKI